MRPGCRGRAGAVLLLAAIALLSSAATGWAATVAETRLAERYAPILELREQRNPPCDTQGEQYLPSPVELVLGRPQISLRGPGPGSPVRKTAPTARDLYGKGKGWFLDFPGSPFDPGCTYARDAIRLGQGRPPTAYAHIVAQAGVPHRLALQYWFFYYFNQFNDLHEGDWEFVQLVFAADDATQALRAPPISIGYSQHDGGERARWADDKLQREGDRLVVYAAAGSHANYYRSSLWLGRSATQGFGCDDTRGPSRRVPTTVRVVPSTPAGPGDPNAWLGFRGNWGEQGPGLFDAPRGPNTQQKWTRPMDWDAKLRDSSFAVPAGNTLGPSVTGAFCGMVAVGSGFYARVTQSPWSALAVVLVLGLSVLALGRRTRWRPVLPRPIFQRRDCGQMLRAARRIYWEHLRLVLVMGLLFVPLGLLESAIQWILFHYTPLHPLSATDGSQGGVTVLLALLVGTVGSVALLLLDAAAVVALHEIDAGRRPSVIGTYRAVLPSLGPLLGGWLLAAVVVVLLILSVVGIPVAIWLVVRWILHPQVCVSGRLGPLQSLRASRDLVRGRWWRTAAYGGLVHVIGVATGPVVGILLLFVTSASLVAINLVGSLVYVAVMPYVAIAMALYHQDLVLRRAEVGAAEPLRPSPASA